ncbi:unnamed protein product [Heterosigma akashiwo]
MEEYYLESDESSFTTSGEEDENGAPEALAGKSTLPPLDQVTLESMMKQIVSRFPTPPTHLECDRRRNSVFRKKVRQKVEKLKHKLEDHIPPRSRSHSKVDTET